MGMRAPKRTVRDRTLIAIWVGGYAAILIAFKLLKGLEASRGLACLRGE
jgi:hypothetical protein